MDANDTKTCISICCKDGPKDEQFKASIVPVSDSCDVIAKAEMLLRLSSYRAFKKPRSVSIVYRTVDGRVVSGDYIVNAVDMHNRGFLTAFCNQLLARTEAIAG